MLLQSCNPGAVFLCRIGAAHVVYHLPHICHVLSCTVERRRSVRLLWLVWWTLLGHARQRERKTHTGHRWHWSAKGTWLSREWNVESLLVNFETVSVRTNTLHMKPLAADWPVRHLRCSRRLTGFACLTLSRIRIGCSVLARRVRVISMFPVPLIRPKDILAAYARLRCGLSCG